jgi:hypothetical protein
MKLENFYERMGRVLLMAPLYRLERRKLKCNDGTEVSCMELGLMTLLFFFEHMLDGKKKAGIRDLAAFLQEQTGTSLFPDFQGYEKLARDIIAVFRPPTGRRNEEAFYDWEIRKESHVSYSYVKADKADIASNEQYYLLDEQGLELIFATKEYFNEYQLSINQLILRKQLEKGQFVLALRQVEEMRLDVETLRGRMHRIQQEIHRSIVSEETLDRYRTIVKDMNGRLQSEEKEFTELKEFIRETRQRIHDNVDKDPERRAYSNILDVERRLDEVHGAHRSLLQAGVDLGTSALAAAEEALYFSGMDSFNFEQEITSRMFAAPLPVTASRRLVEPFLPMESHHTWSPLAIFFPQRLERLERENRQEDFPDWEDTPQGKETLQNIQYHYGRIVRYFLDFLGDKTSAVLGDFISYMQKQDEAFLENRQFYIFWMLLHRRNTLTLDPETIGGDSVYADILKTAPELQSVSVSERSDILTYHTFTISNMDIEVVMDHGVS